MNNIIKKFKALSDETRLRILNIILVRECCVCEVMETLQISQTRASRNLNILYNAGFLKSRRSGLWSFYSIDTDRLNEGDLCLIETISKGLEINQITIADKKKLAQIDRVGIGCAEQTAAV
jgi:ArsR family transcriptional regulator